GAKPRNEALPTGSAAHAHGSRYADSASALRYGLVPRPTQDTASRHSTSRAGVRAELSSTSPTGPYATSPTHGGQAKRHPLLDTTTRSGAQAARPALRPPGSGEAGEPPLGVLHLAELDVQQRLTDSRRDRAGVVAGTESDLTAVPREAV